MTNINQDEPISDWTDLSKLKQEFLLQDWHHKHTLSVLYALGDLNLFFVDYAIEIINQEQKINWKILSKNSISNENNKCLH